MKAVSFLRYTSSLAPYFPGIHTGAGSPLHCFKKSLMARRDGVGLTVSREKARTLLPTSVPSPDSCLLRINSLIVRPPPPAKLQTAASCESFGAS